MGVAVRTGPSFGFLLSLTCFTFVYSAVAPPCMSQLGLSDDGSQHSGVYDIVVSDGDADTLRLNGPTAWVPLNVTSSFVEIRASHPVLLTGLQVQGHPVLSGQITGWSLETSLDCENYHTENYSRDSVTTAPTETVLLRHIEFVSCLRLRPTHFTGETPALRFELLGCEINDNSRCERGADHVAETWKEDGSRQIDFDHDVVLVWVKVLLEQSLDLDTDVTIAHSRTCQSWGNYESSDLNIVSVTTATHKQRWLTVEIERPVKVKCIRIIPPREATVSEVHASACSTHLPSSLLAIGTDTNLAPNHNDEELTAIPTTSTTKTELPSTTDFSQNGFEPTNATLSNVIENSTNDNNIDVFGNDWAQNDSQVDNSSIFSNITLASETDQVGINGSTDNTYVEELDKFINNTIEEQANVYNATAWEESYNMSTNQNNTIDSVPSGSQGADTLTANEQMTSSFQNTGYNQTQCGIRKLDKARRRKRVVGGKVNSPGQWPWLVSMHFLIEFEFTRKSGFKHTCGASLVAPGWVITAAHCFSDDLMEGLSNLTVWRVYFGMHDLARTDGDHNVQERLIEAIYIYPSYNIIAEPLLHDLALVRLNDSVEVNDKVYPLCLDDEADLHDGESQCFVSGWGQISLASPGSRLPYTASLSTMTLSKCKEMYDKLPDDNELKPYARIEAPVLCAAVGANGEDACQGDSGGPLMCERDGLWYQAGIVVGGYLCGHKATPGLYTRIAYYSNWIRTTMGLYDD